MYNTYIVYIVYIISIIYIVCMTAEDSFALHAAASRGLYNLDTESVTGHRIRHEVVRAASGGMESGARSTAKPQHLDATCTLCILCTQSIDICARESIHIWAPRAHSVSFAPSQYTPVPESQYTSG